MAMNNREALAAVAGLKRRVEAGLASPVETLIVLDELQCWLKGPDFEQDTRGLDRRRLNVRDVFKHLLERFGQDVAISACEISCTPTTIREALRQYKRAIREPMDVFRAWEEAMAAGRSFRKGYSAKAIAASKGIRVLDGGGE